MPGARRSSASRRPAERRLRRATVVETHKSFCRFCHAVCGIEVDVEDGRVVAVRGDREHVVSQGYLCVKGRELPAQHTHPARLRGAGNGAPDGDVRRRGERDGDGRDRRAPRRASSRATARTRSRSTPARTGSSARRKPLIVAWVERDRHALVLHAEHDRPAVAADRPGRGTAAGTPACSASPTPTCCCSSATTPACPRSRATAARRTRTPSGICATRERRGMKIIAIDPRRTELARSADLHLQVRPGEDPTLLAGMVRVDPGGGAVRPRRSSRRTSTAWTRCARRSPTTRRSTSRRARACRRR